MKTLVRGQRTRLSDIASGLRLKAGFKAVGSRGGFDVSCFVLGENGAVLSEDYIVFYNQPRSACGGVALMGPEGEDSETVLLDLVRLPGCGPEGRLRRDARRAELHRRIACQPPIRKGC